MCKILALSNLSKVNVDYKLLKALKDVTCVNQRDGFGYAVHNSKGKFGECYTDPREFKRMEMLHHYSKLDQMENVSQPVIDFCYYGKEVYQPHNNKSLIMHGRTATNNCFLENTHPFFSDNGDSFVHNGVIRNKNEWNYPMESNNDSELLANMFWNGGINHVADNVEGYYAFMNIDKDGILHVVKDNKANLHLSYIREIESYIIATAISMIEELCTAMDWIVPTIMEINDCTYFRMNGNEILGYEEFEKVKKIDKLTEQEQRAFKHYEKNDSTVMYPYSNLDNAYDDEPDIDNCDNWSDAEWQDYSDYMEEKYLDRK